MGELAYILPPCNINTYLPEAKYSEHCYYNYYYEYYYNYYYYELYYYDCSSHGLPVNLAAYPSRWFNEPPVPHPPDKTLPYQTSNTNSRCSECTTPSIPPIGRQTDASGFPLPFHTYRRVAPSP